MGNFISQHVFSDGHLRASIWTTRLSLTRPLFDPHEQESTNCPKFLEPPFPNSRLLNCDIKRVLWTHNSGVMRELRGVFIWRILPSTCELIHFCVEGKKKVERCCKNLARSYKTETRIGTPLPMSTISFFQCQWLKRRRIVYFLNTLTLNFIYCVNIQLNCKTLGRKARFTSSFRIFMQNFRRHLVTDM